MSSQFTMQKTIVLGYGGYEKIANSFLNKLIRFETLLTVQYFSWAKVGHPYVWCRNLTYKKEENVNGFINHIQIRSGDDDLFINEAATAKKHRYCLHSGKFHVFKPKTKYKDWLIQKRRHVAKLL
jgi:hypothetical protein